MFLWQLGDALACTKMWMAGCKCISVCCVVERGSQVLLGGHVPKGLLFKKSSKMGGTHRQPSEAERR